MPKHPGPRSPAANAKSPRRRRQVGRSAELLGKSLTVEVVQPDGRGRVVIDRVVLK